MSQADKALMDRFNEEILRRGNVDAADELLRKDFVEPATGERVSVDGMDISRIEDGRIAEHWTQFDVMSLMMQLGAIPEPESAGATG